PFVCPNVAGKRSTSDIYNILIGNENQELLRDFRRKEGASLGSRLPSQSILSHPNRWIFLVFRLQECRTQCERSLPLLLVPSHRREAAGEASTHSLGHLHRYRWP